MTFGLPQAAALMATVAMLFAGAVYLSSKADGAGELPARVVVAAVGVWGAFLFLAWGAAGYASGGSFVESGLAPFALFARAIPALLKAL